MRKYYIDNLRWMSLLWLIPYHTAMAWNVWGEPNYIFFDKNKLISRKSLAKYLYIFLIGYFVITDEKVTDSAQKYCPILLCAGLGASLLNVYLFIWSDENFNTLNTIVKYISEWFMLRASLKTRLIKEKTDRCGSCKESFRRRAFALQGRLTQQMSCIAVFSQKGFLEMPFISLIGFAKKYFNFNGEFSRYLKSRSFLFYIFHFVWVVAFQYLLHNFFENNTAVLFFGTIIFSYAAAFLTCEIVLKIPPICYVTGVKSFPINNNSH